MIKARIILGTIVFLFLSTFFAAIYFGLLTGQLGKDLKNFADKISATIVASLETKSDKTNPGSRSYSEVKININNNTVGSTNSIIIVPSPTPTPVVSRAPVRACSRATVYHLDGSTSNRCYSAPDASQISGLANQYLDLKREIDWLTRVYNQDKKAYEDWGGDLFKQSMENAKRDLDAAQSKLGPIVLQMQEIEKRGW